MNKNFRSSKNLKTIPIQSIVQQKQDTSYLKLKIRSLQEQIQLLKKTNLNIYIPISQKQVPNKDKENKDEIIRKLRVSLLKQQQDNQNLKTQIKRLEKQKQVIKINYQNQIQKKQELIEELKKEMQQLRQQNEQLQERLDQQKQKRQKSEKQLIQIKVQLRFLKQDLQTFKLKYQESNKKYNQLRSYVLNVEFNSKIYKSDKVKITAIQTSQLNNLKNCIFQLQRQIQELLFKLANPKKEQKVILNLQTKNIGEQIVRLKKNIDLQLGFTGDQSVIKSFLNKYTATNQRFKQLIDGCKAPINIKDD